jgi:hypothetical protein
MKTKSYIILPVAVILVLIYGFGGNAKWPGGSPGGYTGSPGDGKNCTQCHGGTASTELGWITSDIPIEGYIPGETYTITVSITGSGDKGFEVSPQDESGNLLGTLIAGTGTHLVSGNKAVTQNSASSANPKVWQFNWVAPEAGTGEVRFYGAFTVNKPVTKLSTLVAQENTAVSISEAEQMSIYVFPNPVHDRIQIKLNAIENDMVSIDLISLGGISIPVCSEIEVQQGKNQLSCLLPSGLAQGSYILQIRFNNFVTTTKILVR